MSISREVEIRQNFSFFQSVVSSLMATHAGKYALLRSEEIVDYFRTAREAVIEGGLRFGEAPFSVQYVIDRPIDLGFLSHATDNRNAVSG